MKKLYTLALAAAVAVSASAAPRHTLGKDFNPEANTRMAQTANFEKFAKANESTTRAKAATNAPKSLDGKSYMFYYDLTYNNETQAQSSIVDFTYEQNQEGIDIYTMTGLTEGLFNGVEVHPQIIGYDSATGELILPAGQDFISFNGGTYTSWNTFEGDQYIYSDVAYYFEWNGNGFDWIKTITSDGVDYTSAGMYVGLEKGDGSVSIVYMLSNFSIAPVNGTMTASMNNGETTESETYPLGVSVNGNKVSINNFFELPAEIECTLDTEAKTLTATDILIGKINVGSQTAPQYEPAYLSAALNDYSAADSFNANGDGVYELVMKYTTGNGKTEITVPDWNVFVMVDNSDWPCFYPILNTSITLDFELGAAGIEGITVDNSNAPVEYFNLQGVRVDNPENGLYIRRQGNNVQKVLVK